MITLLPSYFVISLNITDMLSTRVCLLGVYVCFFVFFFLLTLSLHKKCKAHESRHYFVHRSILSICEGRTWQVVDTR